MEQKQMKITAVAAVVVVAAIVLVALLVPHLNLGGGGEPYREITIEEPYSVSASDYERNNGFRAADGSMLWVFDKKVNNGLGGASHINLGLSVSTSVPPNSITSPDGAKSFTLSFAHQGEFPNKATVNFSVGSDYEGRSFSIFTLGDINYAIGTTKVVDGMASVTINNSTPVLFIETPRVTFDPVIGCEFSVAYVKLGESSNGDFITSVVDFNSDVVVSVTANAGYNLVSVSVNGVPEILPANTTVHTFTISGISADVIVTAEVQAI